MKTKEHRWQLQAAKARFSELVRRALTEGPQYVTRQGKEVVVVLPTAEYQRLKSRTQEGSLLEFFRKSPLVGSGINLERMPDFGRKVKL